METTKWRRTNAQIDADALRAAAKILRAYDGPPQTAHICEVVATSIENGNRKKGTK